MADRGAAGGTVGVQTSAEDPDRPFAIRSVERTLAGRYSTYVSEVQRLIDAGRAVMEREQTLNPRVSDIVAEAGLSNQAFYRHFRSKSELMLAILDDGSRQMASYIESRMGRQESGVAKVRAWVDAMLAQTVMERAASISRGVMLNTLELRAEFPEESDRTADLVRSPLIEAVRLAHRQGQIATKEPDAAAEMVFRLTVSLMENWLLNRQVPSRAEVDRLERFVLHGLGVAEVAPDRPRTTRRARSSS